ncbi:unnamed protein product [Oncorhynchus mykiss]|uniref:Calcineurin-like phosphoesterase domain-containing protein n=1 Tax=Oncorhynchus mykiss TaxID=8022 RepID=A0A060Y1B4_ONCMY|nr:unnamed protein product [Oncorhynchus mykiss]
MVVSPPENQTSIRFLALGDWGGVPYPPYITPVEKATAWEMGKIAEQMGADFVLALGDNFYYSGVNSADSPRFQDTFERVYTADSLNIPWYILAGNHDHAGNVKAQIDYSRKSDICRQDPADNALVPMGQPLLQQNRTVTLFFNACHFSILDLLMDNVKTPSGSVSFPRDGECTILKIKLLIKKSGTFGQFLSHFHKLQSYLKESGVGYVVSGAGNFLDPDTRHWHHVPKDTLKFFTGQASTLGGFVHGEVTKNKMTLTFIQAKGTSLYRTVLPRRDIDDDQNGSDDKD